ncbi:MAG TPA: hypothetical protein VHI93_05030 [Candidatus Thermoplasmatota archaeon]|nr:hypothetical protein [Candidatus Thermoplasmatota archaeon]
MRADGAIPGRGRARGRRKAAWPWAVALLAALAVGLQLPREQAADATPGTEHYRFAFLFHSAKPADVRVEAQDPTILCWAAYNPNGTSALDCEDKASRFDGLVHHYTVTVDCYGDPRTGGGRQTRTSTLATDAQVVVVSVTCG